MKIVFYENSAEHNRLDKTPFLNKLGEVEGVLKDDCSIVEPIITIEAQNKQVIPSTNYVYIEDFYRYYFVDDIVLNYGVYTMKLTVDTLMSYKNSILALKGFVTRTEKPIYDEPKIGSQIDDKILFGEGYDIKVIDTNNTPVITRQIGSGDYLFVITGYHINNK